MKMPDTEFSKVFILYGMIIVTNIRNQSCTSKLIIHVLVVKDWQPFTRISFSFFFLETFFLSHL
jgi:hypothetical protein